MSSQEIKRNITTQINRSKKVIAGIKRQLTIAHPNYDTILTISKYHENEVRIHSMTIMLIEAEDIGKPKSHLIRLVKKRMEYQQIAMEILPELVRAGVIAEANYLEACREFQKDYQLLHADLDNMDE
jgi:hypothetical protein